MVHVLGPLRRRVKTEKPRWQPPDIGLQPLRQEASSPANAERMMERPLDECVPAGLGLLGLPGACLSGLGVPKSPGIWKCRAEPLRTSRSGALTPTSVTTGYCFRGPLPTVTTHSPPPGFSKAARGTVTFPAAQTSLSAPSGGVTACGWSLPDQAQQGSEGVGLCSFPAFSSSPVACLLHLPLAATCLGLLAHTWFGLKSRRTIGHTPSLRP